MEYNLTIVACLISLISAQWLKVITTLISERSWNFRLAMSTGGMPSSHSSLVATLNTIVFLEKGAGSLLFAVTLIFGGIVLYDATGVRQAAGKHAEILNEILEEFRHLFNDKSFPLALKTMLGHTGMQVLMGTFYGILVGTIAYYFL